MTVTALHCPHCGKPAGSAQTRADNDHVEVSVRRAGIVAVARLSEASAWPVTFDCRECRRLIALDLGPARRVGRASRLVCTTIASNK